MGVSTGRIGCPQVNAYADTALVDGTCTDSSFCGGRSSSFLIYLFSVVGNLRSVNVRTVDDSFDYCES